MARARFAAWNAWISERRAEYSADRRDGRRQKGQLMLSDFQREEFIKRFSDIARACHEMACEKGFWGDGPKSAYPPDRKIVLMHSELSELLEAIRDPNTDQQSVVDYYSPEEIELADLVIRAMDYAGGRELRLAGAILAKMDYNAGRPFKHGKLY